MGEERADKTLVILSGEIKTPPVSQDARREIGFLIRQLQKGLKLEMPQSRPMPSVGRRCHELRLNDAGQTWRVIYRTDLRRRSRSGTVQQEDDQDTKARDRPSQETATRVRRRLTTEVTMPLGAKKKARIEAMGGRVTTVEEWLDLTPEEVAVIDMKIRLGEELKACRQKKRLSQERVAKILKTSQGRVSKLEKGQATLDQLARSLLALGGSTKQVARAISG